MPYGNLHDILSLSGNGGNVENNGFEPLNFPELTGINPAPMADFLFNYFKNNI